MMAYRYDWYGEAYRQRILEGDPYAVDVVSGPFEGISDAETRPGTVGFIVPWNAFMADLDEAGHSENAVALLRFLEAGLGEATARDINGLTPVHLAALSGSPQLLRAIVDRARASAACSEPWTDKNGRTPLHYVAFFDCAELVEALGDFCDLKSIDRWGFTAVQLAKDLGNHRTALALAPETKSLGQLCAQRVQQLLSSDDGAAKLLASLDPADARTLSTEVPLHEYEALARLHASLPEAVDFTTLRRSMSCLECWYGDLLTKGCSPALPKRKGLVEVWQDLATFRGGSQAEAEGAIILRAPRRKPPTVASRALFLERFHKRTGGLFVDFDWSNLCVIGGMVLACLIADDEEYQRNFRETDVDFYVVGLSGKAFRDRVKSLVKSLPKPVGPLGFAATRATYVRTAQTITACLRTSTPLPNVQVVLAPYASHAHLLFTTDIDCTALAFDGQRLWATPRAREAIRTRRIIARPEKYMVRGEWRTEARLLKYAQRGFDVVDLGLQPGCPVPRHEKLEKMVRGMHEILARPKLKQPALDERLSREDKLENARLEREARQRVDAKIEEVRSAGVYGAQLVLLAGNDPSLRNLMLHERPLLRAGLVWNQVVSLVGRVLTGGENIDENSDDSDSDSHDDDHEAGAQPVAQGSEIIDYQGAYGRAKANLVMINPTHDERIGDGGLRGREMSLSEAIVELDLEADRFETRGWYDGMPEASTRGEHAMLNPDVWKGVGDFRAAA